MQLYITQADGISGGFIVTIPELGVTVSFADDYFSDWKTGCDTDVYYATMMAAAAVAATIFANAFRARRKSTSFPRRVSARIHSSDAERMLRA